MTTKIFRGTLIAVAAGITLSLTACSGAGGQSVADACGIANKTMTKVTSDAQEALNSAAEGGDLSGVFSPVQDALASAKKQITNPEVSKALESYDSEFSNLAEKVKGYELPNLAELDPADPETMAQLDEIQAEASKLGEELTAGSEKLTEAGKQLAAVCAAG